MVTRLRRWTHFRWKVQHYNEHETRGVPYCYTVNAIAENIHLALCAHTHVSHTNNLSSQ